MPQRRLSAFGGGGESFGQPSIQRRAGLPRSRRLGGVGRDQPVGTATSTGSCRLCFKIH